MGKPTVVVEIAGQTGLAKDLAAGGVFVPGCTVGMNVDVELVVKGSRDGEELRIAATVVWVDGERGAGLQLTCDEEVKRRIVAMAQDAAAGEAAAGMGEEAEAAPHAAAEAEPEAAADADGAKRPPASLQERLRHLTLAQQIKLAHGGEVSERVVLERLYGKNVWDALLHNPRLTGPEVARIARMGSLPRPLVELIVGNGGWLQIPEVRRALLANPRLGTDQMLRVLRLLPKHELKLATSQTAYPLAVRDAAKRMLREAAGG